VADFHFLRPELLFALIPLLAALAFQIRKHRLSGGWDQVVAPQLREFVIKQAGNHKQSGWLKWVLGACIAFAIIAAAGPSWEKQASQIYNSRSGIIVALDLSLSMTAQDVSPSRLQRAKYKITDILNKESSRNIGLMAYASDTHIASPLTRDADTLKSLLPALDPFIMPGTGGSNTQRLAEQAVELFKQSQSEPRVLVMVSDGVEPQDIQATAELLKQHDIQLSILAIGTEQGAPMLQPDGRFFKGADGQPIMPRLEWENLTALAEAANGRIRRFSNTDTDIDYLLADTSDDESFQAANETAVFDQWQDAGYWLMIPVLILALFAFRRGVIVVLVVLAWQPTESWALPDFLLNQDQLAHKKFDTEPDKAAEQFSNSEWKASSLYKAGKYEEALELWRNQDDASGWYNRGNTLAQLGQFDEALHAYDKALSMEPNMEDAQFNKALVEQLKQQQEQNQQSSEQSDSSDQNSEGSEQQDQQGQNSDQQNSQQEQQSTSNETSDQNGEPQDSTQSDSQDASENPMNQLSQEEKGEDKSAQESMSKSQSEDESTEEEGSQELSQAQGTQSGELTEKDQAVMQMIQKIPDDPAGLLQRKFLHQYQQRNRQPQRGDRKSW